MSEHIIETEVWAGTPFVPVGGTGGLREEIVRCKDCACMERQTTYDGSMSWFLCSHFKRPTRFDGFCAWGVRK